MFLQSVHHKPMVVTVETLAAAISPHAETPCVSLSESSYFLQTLHSPHASVCSWSRVNSGTFSIKLKNLSRSECIPASVCVPELKPVLLLGCNECPGGLWAPMCLSDQQVNRIKSCSEAFRGRRTGAVLQRDSSLQTSLLSLPSHFSLSFFCPSYYPHLLWTCRSVSGRLYTGFWNQSCMANSLCSKSSKRCWMGSSCRTVKFYHTKLGKPLLYGPFFVLGGIIMLKQEKVFPKL